MFKEMLITMYAGCHNVKWIYFNNAKSKLFLKWNCEFINAPPDLHIVGSATKAEYILRFLLWSHIGRSDECCIGSFQHSRMNVSQNLLVIFSEGNVSLRNGLNAKIWSNSPVMPIFVSLISVEVFKLILVKSEWSPMLTVYSYVFQRLPWNLFSEMGLWKSCPLLPWLYYW